MGNLAEAFVAVMEMLCAVFGGGGERTRETAVAKCDAVCMAALDPELMHDGGR